MELLSVNGLKQTGNFLGLTSICFSVSGGVSGPQVTTVTYTEAEVVQYAASISINIRLQKGTTLGKIYPPYLTITYGNVKLQDKNSGKKVAVRQVVTIPLMNYLIQIMIHFPFGGDIVLASRVSGCLFEHPNP